MSTMTPTVNNRHIGSFSGIGSGNDGNEDNGDNDGDEKKPKRTGCLLTIIQVIFVLTLVEAIIIFLMLVFPIYHDHPTIWEVLQQQATAIKTIFSHN